jgi:glycosyltransferase involved in cell wall biosynthesis
VRILVVHNYYQDPGGEDAVFHQEVEALKKNHSVETLTFKNRKGFLGLLQYLFYPYNIWAAFCLRKKVRHFHPEIIHVHNTHYACGPIIFRTAQRLRIPVVFTLHNYRLLCPSALLFFDGKMYTESIESSFPWDGVKKGVLDHSVLKTFLTAFTYKLHSVLGTWKKVDAYLPLTNYAKSLILKSKLNIHPDKIIVKPNFITLSDKTNSTATKAEPYFLFVGRLSEEKGILQLIASFNKSASKSLKIIGDGPLRKYISDLKNPRIELLGFLQKEEIFEYIRKATAVIIPSVWLEGLPMVLLETLSLKRPVVISEIVAASEIIRDNQNGFVINPSDFSEKLDAIAKDKKLPEISENGFKTLEQQFTKEKVMNQLEGIYAGLIK